MKSIKTVDEWGGIRYMNEKSKLHRIDGPAYEKMNRYKAWIINGIYHREDGPAVIWSDGTEWYYLKGKEYTKEQWEREIIKLKLKRIKEL